MYDKILVAVDHSAASDRALLAARDLALLSQGEVWVLHLREREIAVKTGLAMIGRANRKRRQRRGLGRRRQADRGRP